MDFGRILAVKIGVEGVLLPTLGWNFRVRRVKERGGKRNGLEINGLVTRGTKRVNSSRYVGKEENVNEPI